MALPGVAKGFQASRLAGGHTILAFKSSYGNVTLSHSDQQSKVNPEC